MERRGSIGPFNDRLSCLIMEKRRLRNGEKDKGSRISRKKSITSFRRIA